jgi:hypothetical protein
MATIAIIANGTLLQMGAGTSGGSKTTVPEVTKLSGPSVKFDLLDATSHDSEGGFREYIPGLSDGDTIAADLNWRPSNTVHISLREESYDRSLIFFDTVFPDDTDNTVETATYIQSIMPKADIGAILTAGLTLKVTGLPSWS